MDDRGRSNLKRVDRTPTCNSPTQQDSVSRPASCVRAAPERPLSVLDDAADPPFLTRHLHKFDALQTCATKLSFAGKGVTAVRDDMSRNSETWQPLPLNSWELPRAHDEAFSAASQWPAMQVPKLRARPN